MIHFKLRSLTFLPVKKFPRLIQIFQQDRFRMNIVDFLSCSLFFDKICIVTVHMLSRVKIAKIDVRVWPMSGQGLEILPESLTHLLRGGRTVTETTCRWEMDSRTLALIRRKLGLFTSIRGDKANEPSERGLAAWCN